MACGHASECVCWGRAAWCARGRRATWLMVCPWAAARPRAVRAASFARRVVSKPGQALPPPTGPAAWPSVPSGTLHTGGACVAVCGWVRRLEARPGPAAAHGPRSLAPQPSGPVGTLHTGGACVAWTSPARPCRRPPAPRPGPPDPPAPSTPAALVVLCVPAGNWGVTALLSPGLVPLDSEAFDDLCARECSQDLARHKELRSAQARADAAPSDRARRVDKEPP